LKSFETKFKLVNKLYLPTKFRIDNHTDLSGFTHLDLFCSYVGIKTSILKRNISIFNYKKINKDYFLLLPKEFKDNIAKNKAFYYITIYEYNKILNSDKEYIDNIVTLELKNGKKLRFIVY
jgi:hypothetical protein